MCVTHAKNIGFDEKKRPRGGQNLNTIKDLGNGEGARV